MKRPSLSRRVIRWSLLWLLAMGLLHLGVTLALQQAERAAESAALDVLAGRWSAVNQLMLRQLEGLESYFELITDLHRLRVGSPHQPLGIEQRVQTMVQQQRFGVF